MLKKSLPLLLAALVLAGCHHAQLQTRVQRYWDSFSAGDYRQAYNCVLADGITYEEFLSRAKPAGAAPLVSWKLVDIRPLSEDEARVDLRLSYRTPLVAKPLEIEAVDTWVLRSGDWYRIVPKPRSPFESVPPRR